MRKRISLTALILLTSMLAGCMQPAADAPVLMEPVGVQSDTAAAYIGDIYDVELFESAVVPYVEEMYFEVNGSVESVNVYPGMMVEEGDILIELDQTSLVEREEALRKNLEYAQCDNAYADAMAEIDIEILELELKELEANHADETQIALKKNEIEQKKAALRQAQAMREPDMEVMRRELEAISEDLNKNILRAPFSGRVVYGMQLVQGSWVTAYDPVIYLADDSKLSLSGEFISESKLDNADRVYARIGAQDYDITQVPIDQNEYITLVLTGGTLTTQFDINGPEEHMDLLEAGQYAAVLVVSGLRSDVLLVPSGAVLRDATGRYVYVDEDGERVRRMVKTGKSTDGLVQITEGLEEGEVVYVKD